MNLTTLSTSFWAVEEAFVNSTNALRLQGFSINEKPICQPNSFSSAYFMTSFMGCVFGLKVAVIASVVDLSASIHLCRYQLECTVLSK